jgi:UDP-glucose 4-epimerase
MQVESKKVLILGHSGFIGSRLNAYLSQSHRWDVVGASLPALDLTNEEQSRQLLPHLGSDTTVVLAAAVKRQFGDSLQAFEANMAIVQNLCRLLEMRPVKRVVFMSSAAVYGEETENTEIVEETQVNPTSYYGLSKYSAERLLLKTCFDNGRTTLVRLRPPLVYGPNDPGRTYGPSGFSALAMEGQPIVLWGDGTELREFLFIDDLCAIIEAQLDSDFEGALNVVSGASSSFYEVTRALQKLFPNLVVDSRPRSKQKVDNAFDARKMMSQLSSDFQFTSLEQGLLRMLAPSK